MIGTDENLADLQPEEDSEEEDERREDERRGGVGLTPDQQVIATLPLYQTMALLHVATLTVQRELPKYEIIFSI